MSKVAGRARGVKDVRAGPNKKQRIEPACSITYKFRMPELSRFFGIIIRMYAEVGAPHHGAHFHAYYQDSVGIFQIDPVEMIAGGLPARQRRFVEAWAELHRNRPATPCGVRDAT